MENDTAPKNRLPLSFFVIWGGSALLAMVLFTLAPVLLLYHKVYITSELAIWAESGLFVVAVIYGYLLLFHCLLLLLIKRSDREVL